MKRLLVIAFAAAGWAALIAHLARRSSAHLDSTPSEGTPNAS